MLDHQPHPLEVDRDGPVERRFVDLEDRAPPFAVDPGVVEQHGGQAEFGDGARDDPLDIGGDADVRADRNGATSCGADFVHHWCHPRLVEIDRRDFRALTREQQRGGLAHAPRRAGDDRDLARQAHLSATPCSDRRWC